MSLYKIIIVDDEEEIRLGIIKKIDWKSYGFQIIGEAENGQEALEKAEKLQPDIIMTDIRMPFMDGLELGKKLSEVMPSSKIIVFSGCDDFEYAQKAIRLNVIEYVLKPINSVELIEMLKRLKIMLDKEYNEKRNIEILQQHYIESIPVIREQFLVGASEGRGSEDEWKNKLFKLKIDLELPYFVVGIIHLDSEQLDDTEFKENKDLLQISIKKVLEEVMEKCCSFISFLYLDKVIVIGNFNGNEEIKNFINSLDEVCRSFKRIVGLNISVGVGKMYDSFEKISISYKEAQSALEYRVILGNGKAIYIEDMEPDTSIQLHLDENVERLMINTIKIESKEEISKVVNSLFNIYDISILPFNEYRIYIMEIMISLLKLVKSYSLNLADIFGSNFNCYTYLDNFNSITEIKEWFIEKSFKINTSIKNERVNSSKIIIEKAKEYIKENYMDYDLSVEKMCSNLHVSQTYFSTIFKKETNTSFVNFLTEVRLEEAVRLLNTTDYKTYMIAEKVGYPEANYFSYVFKKKFGISPSKYRKS